MGHFEEHLTRHELKKVAKYAFVMWAISAAGHALFRYTAGPVVWQYIHTDSKEVAKRAMDEYLVQRTYMKERSEGKK